MRYFLFVLVIFTSLNVFAEKLHLSAKTGSWTFQTSNIRSADETSSGFGAYAIQLDYGILPKWQLAVIFNMLMSDGFTGSQGFGVDVGANYYPLTQSTSVVTNNENVNVSISETWRPYVGLFLRQRTFNFILATTFVGTGIDVGVDYKLNEKWFLNAEIRYDMLFGSDDGEATQINLLIGAGLEF